MGQRTRGQAINGGQLREGGRIGDRNVDRTGDRRTSVGSQRNRRIADAERKPVGIKPCDRNHRTRLGHAQASGVGRQLDGAASIGNGGNVQRGGCRHPAAHHRGRSVGRHGEGDVAGGGTAKGQCSGVVGNGEGLGSRRRTEQQREPLVVRQLRLIAWSTWNQFHTIGNVRTMGLKTPWLTVRAVGGTQIERRQQRPVIDNR